MIPNCLTESQRIAVGAVLIWRILRGGSDPLFRKVMAQACIKLQTYF